MLTFMLGFLSAVLAAGLMAAFVARRWRKRWRSRGGAHPGASMSGRLMARLDVAPEQEAEVADALDELVTLARALGEEARNARTAVAGLLRGEELDDAAMDSAVTAPRAAMDGLLSGLRRTLGRLHQVLDAGQRERLAALLERGPFGRGRHGGPGCRRRLARAS